LVIAQNGSIRDRTGKNSILQEVSMHLTAMTVSILVISAIISTAYGVWDAGRAVSKRRTFLKTASIALLAVGFAASGAPMFLIFALLLCACGDFFLSKDGETNFLLGMAAFAVGHLFYIPLFIQIGAAGDYLTPKIFQISIFLIFGLIMATVLWGKTKNLRVPVLVYLLIIVLMALTALALPPVPAFRVVLIGVGLFVISDAVLAFETFIWPAHSLWRRISPYTVWFLYWTAQVLIGLGVLQGASGLA